MPAGYSLWGTWWGRVAVAPQTPPPPPTTYTIKGQVKVGTALLSGVTVKLTGTRAATVTTDASGNYSFAGLPTGNYTVTPSKLGYLFTPTKLSFTSLSANQTAANFTAAQRNFTIRGRVTLGTSGLSGVTVKLSGARTLTATTNSLGDYSFANLPAGGNYTATPSKSGFTFTPVRRAFTYLRADQTSSNFTATQN